MWLRVYRTSVNVNDMYYVHVCEQVRWARSAENNAIGNVCMYYYCIDIREAANQRFLVTVLRQRPYTVCGSPAFPMNNWVVAAEKGPFRAINTRNVWRNTQSKIGGINFRPAGSRHQSDDRPLKAVCEPLTSLLVDIVCLKGDTGVQNWPNGNFG